MRTLLYILILGTTAQAAVYRTGTNFAVEAPSEACARRVLHDAEKARQDFARSWLGREIDAWDVPVIVVVQIDPNRRPNGRQMVPGSIFALIVLNGPTEAEAERSLRHEVGHAVICREVPEGNHAPRWLHEGVCVADELVSGSYPDRFEDKIGREPLVDFFPRPGLPIWADGDEFYGQSASLVCYIREKYGVAAVWKFYTLGRTWGYGAACLVLFRTTVDRFEADWTTWTYSLSSPYPRSIRGTK